VKNLDGLENFSRQELELTWQARLSDDRCESDAEKQQSIIRWLLGKELESLDRFTPRQFAIANQVMDYRYQILRQRYLGVEPTQAYCNLIDRLSSLMMLCRKTRTWIAFDREKKKAMVSFIQTTVAEMLTNDRAIQQQMAWIARCTQDRSLRDALLLSSLEEYCLHPVRHQPLLIERMTNFLKFYNVRVCNRL
jgi:hypothetical protein